MGIYEERPQFRSVMHWQCERVAGDNNNRAARACGGCEPRTDPCGRLEPCSACDPRLLHSNCNNCGRPEPCQECGSRNRDACSNCGNEACDGCRSLEEPIEPCNGCGRKPCVGCSRNLDGCSGCGQEACSGCEPRGDEGESCAGCGRLIKDRYFLEAVERRWHAPCLRCSECGLTLDSELTCFARDGNIFCKKDYYRLFGTRRCARCQANISSSELVMRARDLVFHVHCFCCALCNTQLTKGDTFGMRDSTVYCRLHYEAMNECTRVPRPPSEMMTSPFFNGTSTPVPAPTPTPGAPRQKGRPRKRKPKDLEAMTANLDLNTEYLDMGFCRSGSGVGNSSRTKRMRTSFKHHQLRTMKSYFAINHNPDAKDLKQLSQKTGLPKRVLQVWFQNARAKWRRMMTKQEGKLSSDKMSPDGSVDLDGFCGPGSGTGGMRLPSRLMDSLSPPSLDCQ